MSVKKSKQTKVLVIDTLEFFEIEVPIRVNPNSYLHSEECRKICAEAILSQTANLVIERIEGE